MVTSYFLSEVNHLNCILVSPFLPYCSTHTQPPIHIQTTQWENNRLIHPRQPVDFLFVDDKNVAHTNTQELNVLDMPLWN